VEDRLAELEQRLVRSEKHTRALSGALFLMGVGACSLLLAAPGSGTAPTQSSTVKAPFRVVDDTGRLLAEVSASRTGMTVLNLRGSAADDVVALGTGQSGGFLQMEKPDGSEKVRLATAPARPGWEFVIRGEQTEVSLLAGGGLAGMKANYTGGGQVLVLANRAGGSVSPTNGNP
jgi:hypothetical protein